jgi:hypothetical protein
MIRMQIQAGNLGLRRQDDGQLQLCVPQVLSRPEDKQVVAAINGLAEAAAEAAPAHAADELRCLLVHARIPIEEVRDFWAQVQELARRFAQIPRAGDKVYGFAAGLYPTDAPTLPDADHDPAD